MPFFKHHLLPFFNGNKNKSRPHLCRRLDVLDNCKEVYFFVFSALPF